MDFFEKLKFVVKTSKASMLAHGFTKSERRECIWFIKALKQGDIQKAEDKLSRIHKTNVKDFCESIKHDCLTYYETKTFE